MSEMLPKIREQARAARPQDSMSNLESAPTATFALPTLYMYVFYLISILAKHIHYYIVEQCHCVITQCDIITCFGLLYEQNMVLLIYICTYNNYYNCNRIVLVKMVERLGVDRHISRIQCNSLAKIIFTPNVSTANCCLLKGYHCIFAILHPLAL